MGSALHILGTTILPMIFSEARFPLHRFHQKFFDDLRRIPPDHQCLTAGQGLNLNAPSANPAQPFRLSSPCGHIVFGALQAYRRSHPIDATVVTSLIRHFGRIPTSEEDHALAVQFVTGQ